MRIASLVVVTCLLSVSAGVFAAPPAPKQPNPTAPNPGARVHITGIQPGAVDSTGAGFFFSVDLTNDLDTPATVNVSPLGPGPENRHTVEIAPRSTVRRAMFTRLGPTCQKATTELTLFLYSVNGVPVEATRTFQQTNTCTYAVSGRVPAPLPGTSRDRLVVENANITLTTDGTNTVTELTCGARFRATGAFRNNSSVHVSVRPSLGSLAGGPLSAWPLGDTYEVKPGAVAPFTFVGPTRYQGEAGSVAVWAMSTSPTGAPGYSLSISRNCTVTFR